MVALSACGGSTDAATDGVGVAHDSIVNGTASGADDDAVVLIFTHVPEKDTPQGQYYLNCTGVLLAPNLVLTARHCVSETSNGNFTCKMDGSLGTGTGGKVLADFTPAESHVLVGAKLPDTLDPTTFPGTGSSYVHDSATVLCNADVALIVLAKPIADAKIAPIRLDAPVTPDEGLSVVGWGATVTDFLPSQRQRRDGVTVVEVGPSSTFHVGGQLGANEFLASESVCTGDSGGPAFDAKTGAVVGVVSRGPNGGITTNGSGCVGTQHTFMQTAPFKGLVMEAFAQAGGEPWLEGQPAPGQGTGGGGTGGGGAGGGGTGGSNEESGGCAVRPTGSAGGVGAWLTIACGLALVALRKRRA